MRRTLDGLIRDVFPDEATTEFNALPVIDRFQLGSAIARQQGLLPEQVDFEFVPY